MEGARETERERERGRYIYIYIIHIDSYVDRWIDR